MQEKIKFLFKFKKATKMSDKNPAKKEPEQSDTNAKEKPENDINENNQPSNIRMKLGDYMVHIFIEQGRALMPPGGADTSDPVIAVTAFNQQKSTKALNDVGGSSIVYWGEHIFIEGKNIHPEEFKDQRITIEVRDHNKLWKDALLGVHEIDMVYIYSQKDHAIIHRWVVLSNPEDENFDVVRGYLKIGVSVLYEDDKAVDLAIREDMSIKDKEMLLPPHVKPVTVQLITQILKAESLPIMDTGGTLDAYCVARFAGAESKTSTQAADKATLSAYWYEEIYLPVLVPSVTNTMSLTFWDYDSTSADDLVGSVIFSFDKIKRGLYKDYFWANIYGAPPLAEGEAAEFMNHVPQHASTWRGRVLLRQWVEDGVSETYKKTQKISEPNIQIKIRDTFEVGQEFEIRAQILSGNALPFKKGKYSVVVSWSGVESISSLQQTETASIDWYETLKRQICMVPNLAEKDLPDVFIYLVYEDKRICYARIKPSACINKNSQAEWVSLIPDKSIGKVKENWKAGFLRVRIYIGLFDNDNDELRTGNWDQKLIKPKMEDWVLLAHVFQARDLPAADGVGLSDPYLVIYCAGVEVSTKNKPREQTLNPRWYETFPMQIRIPTIEDAPPVILSVFDYDVISKDDMMGRALINLSDASLNTEIVARPKWYPINLGTPESEKGAILCSFTLARPMSVPRFNITPKFVDKTVEINILGLRGLKPAVGFLPVKKAFVRVDLNSLELPEVSQGVKFLQTQPFEGGSDPNINSTLSFRCKIPEDPLYAPVLTCTVCDNLFAGLSQPLIGTFSIDLGKYSSQKSRKSQLLLDQFMRVTTNLTQNRPGIEEEKISVEPKSAKNQPEILVPPKFEAVDLSDYAETEAKQDFKHLVPIKAARSDEYMSPKGYFNVSQEEVELEIKEDFTKFSEKVITIEDAVNNNKIVIMPQYKENKSKKMIEIYPPNPDNYLCIGYNREQNDGKKHYRYYLHDELEKTPAFQRSAFEEFDILRGASRGVDELPTLHSTHQEKDGQKSTVECVGKFKALIRVIDYPPKWQPFGYLTGLMGNKDFPDEDSDFETIARTLLVKTQCVVRVYIIDAMSLEQKDAFSKSDPYFKLKLGGRVINNREEHQEDVCDPKFYKCYDFETTIPGQSLLKLSMWDYNKVFPDSKIGTTIIDIEDRFFNKTWRSLKEVPIETRALYLAASRRPQGYVRMWVEIHYNTIIPDPVDISLRPPASFEARLIIWRCEDVENMDFEGVSDLFVRAWINQEKDKETDTHYRCQRGKGSWNWRMKFPISLPQPENTVTIQIWDRDIFSRNDFIAETSFEFNELAAAAIEENRRIKKKGPAEGWKDRVLNEENEKFWVNCKKRGKEGGFEDGGKVLISFELVPEMRAQACPVGEGRNEPNVDPKLPPPIGRFEWSLNPLKMISQLCGPEFKMKICLAICCALCCMAMIFVFPMFISSVMSNLVTK
ncbi:unnamed protein product [Blepharisma stoltei]|uniref:C2 domain-containing protein n=1 Tax=Blepharisma stoltei TaxID=1481888 RepID=A0AAU9INX2_9CILI|nr:unnamed protein product [Blepharisma stoltei]